MTDPVKARDVLHELWCDPVRWGDGSAGKDADLDKTVAELLNVTPDGEGVYIAPDGTLMRAYAVNAYDPDRDDPDDYDRNVYRLVPIEGDDRD